MNKTSWRNPARRARRKLQARNYRNSQVVDFQGKTEQQIKDSELMAFVGIVGLVTVIILIILS